MKTLITFILLCHFLPSNSAEARNTFIAETSTVQLTVRNSINDTTSKEQYLIKPFYLDLVPPSSGVQFFRNGIIFLAHSKADEKVPEKHLSFGTLKTFMTTIQDTIPGIYMPFLLTSEVIFPCEATTFTSDFNTMYVSLIPANGNKEKIFRAVYGSSGWNIDKTPLSFCEDNFIFTHPSISSDGTFMIFSTDMSGSAGGLDLYISRSKDGNWSEPENLGKHINTTGNELFACLDSENNLYFSSDGIHGEGGYDIFVCIYDGNTWGKPYNLSKTINTQDDEVAFTVSKPENNSAFYSSRSGTAKNKTSLFIVNLNPGYKDAADSNLSHHLLAMAGVQEKTSVYKTEETPRAIQTQTEQIKTEVKEKPEEKITPTTKSQPVRPIEKKETVAQAVKTTVAPQEAEKKDIVVYRVQILANTKPVGSYTITVAGKTYKSFEYLYKGGYRTTIGEFSTLNEAAKLQTECRKNGYNQAFVVAFKNNIRTTDPELFK